MHTRSDHWLRRNWVPTLGLVAFLLLATSSATAATITDPPLLAAAKGTLKPAQITVNGVTKTMPFFSDGAVETAAEALDNGDRKEAADAVSNPNTSADTMPSVTNNQLGLAPLSWGCAKRDTNTSSTTGGSGDQRANQDCTFRRQAEEDIVFNPADPSNLLAGQNDNRAGYNQCGIDFSLDNGGRWGDVWPPFRQRENSPERMLPGTSNNRARNVVTNDPNKNTINAVPGTHKTYDAAADPTVAFDSQGRGYFSCVLFDIRDNASGLYVTESPAGAKGSFFFNVPTNPESEPPPFGGAHG